MNYRHVYHAGNFADVMKHVILISLMTALSRKETPFCYIDTHAGTGYYDLFSEQTQKSREYLNGIKKIIEQENPPALIQHYLDCIHQMNNTLSRSAFASLAYYPGSPLIARYLMRPKDRMIACELHREDYQSLHANFTGDKQVAIHHIDGFLGLKAFLPPPEKRGLILIDPPYEDTDEFNRISHALPAALKRFANGIYAIWFPIKEKRQTEHFYRTLTTLLSRPILAIELTIFPDLANHLNGCGMVVINPPWQFAESMNEVLPWLWQALSINKQGGYRSFMLE